jgi:pyruvate kinase
LTRFDIVPKALAPLLKASMNRLVVLLSGREGFASAGQIIVAIAGMPFGTPGSTNLMRIATA